MPADSELMQVLLDAKKLARRYRELTGRPLGITGEVAEYEAARILGLTLTPARQEGYDATEVVDGVRKTLQIKGRCVQEGNKASQRLGGIQVSREWDSVLMVLLDHNLDATEIWEADRFPVIQAIEAPGSVHRNGGALAVSKVKAIGHCRWKRAPNG